jgi:hypothetical protein
MFIAALASARIAYTVGSSEGLFSPRSLPNALFQNSDSAIPQPFLQK